MDNVSSVINSTKRPSLYRDWIAIGSFYFFKHLIFAFAIIYRACPMSTKFFSGGGYPESLTTSETIPLNLQAEI